MADRIPSAVVRINTINSESVALTMECYPTLREKGQVTIPEEIRAALGLTPGDRLKLTVEKLD